MQTSYKVLYTSEVKKFIKKNKVIGLKFFEAFTELSKNSNLRALSFDIVWLCKDTKTYTDLE